MSDVMADSMPRLGRDLRGKVLPALLAQDSFSGNFSPDSSLAGDINAEQAAELIKALQAAQKIEV